MSDNRYSPLTREQIEALECNGCRCDDWNAVQVADGFEADAVSDVVFRGQVRVGRTDGTVPCGEGLSAAAGIREAELQDVAVGDNVRIANVRGRLANLDIGDGALIEDVGTIACTGKTSFGNGHEIEVLNEGGGRELKITALTSSQSAYLTVLYRHNPGLVAALNAMADRHAEAATAERASIGTQARITRCGVILNVAVGPHAELDGAQSLKEGSIVSSETAPAKVGAGVIAEDFIFQQGASVQDGAMVAGSLVGEGARIGKQFSAENSVFFANSEGFHSEACSVFAGPYTVTHHRSTLLIAALFSFYNAGSGTNQSNHMYKLGPVHQGIMERGCKTGSFSYLLWPSRVGAFTAVMGKHYANFDTSDFPFSYVSEEDGRSTLVPGMNFFTVGTMRDGEKWPSRDRRENEDPLDLIIFDVLSPYTGQKMIRGSRTLAELYGQSERSQEYVTYRGIHIKRLLLKTCRRYYDLALDKYLGDVLVSRLESAAPGALRDVLAPAEGEPEEWIDLCGLLCRRSRVEDLVEKIVNGDIESLASLQSELKSIHSAYRDDEWEWFLAAYKQVKGKDLCEEDDDALRAFLDRWRSASHKLLNMVKNDAQKEFEGDTRTGFGIDGERDADFDAVRGTFDGNKFVKKLAEDAESVDKRHEAATRLVG